MSSEQVDKIIGGMKYKKYFNLNEVEKDLIDNHDTDLNTCNKCDVVVDSATELYWQGSCADSYHECMKGYDALCDDCFEEVSENE
tara:strand:- start:572 stop:826 length:255 start_codon:yes stop_codon:yes gene_type:complete